MNIAFLWPRPSTVEAFHRARQRFVPAAPGCYALTNFAKDVIYVGLAQNLRRRFGQHLDDPGKTAVTPLGKATLFHWVETEDIQRVERTWMNIHLQHEATLPPLNRLSSPV